MSDERLPAGVEVRDLRPHADDRGTFTELFRQSWAASTFTQWNAVRSEAGVLRGVHVHVRHADYVTVPVGRMRLGLRDLRPDSLTAGHAVTMLLDELEPRGVLIPPGVAHGFHFERPSLHVYAVTHYWDPADELGCRWDDPDLEIPWAPCDPLLSARDASLGGLAALRAELEARLQAPG